MVERAAKYIHIQFAHSVILKHSARRPDAEKCYVVVASVESELCPVEAALYRGESEITDQSLNDARIHKRRQTFVPGLDLSSIQKCESAQSQSCFFRELKRDVGLFRKPIHIVSMVAIGGKVRTAQPKLPEAARLHGRVRQVYNRIRRAF